MKKTTLTIATLALTGVTFTAAAGQSTSSVFVSQDSPVLLAQADAVEDYSQYLRRMMMEDKDMMPMLDANDDGEISDQEFRQTYERVFESFDTNDDGMIDESEMGNDTSEG